MKKNLLPFLLCLITITAKSQTGNLVSINPNTAAPTQTLTTTITGNATVFQNSSPQGNIINIYLQGSTTVNADLPSLAIQDNQHLTVNFTIPSSTTPGTYSLNVSIKEWSTPPFNSYTLNLPSAFIVSPPDGYIRGSVYNDLNRNGIRDLGETGVANQAVKLDNYIIYTDVNGNYSIPAFNGSHTVSYMTDTSAYILASPLSYAVNINNNNSSNNDFGLTGLVSVTPNVVLQGKTIEMTVLSDSVFRTSANLYGNVTQAVLKHIATGTIYSAGLSNIKTTHPDTALITFSIPPNAYVGNYDLILYVDSIYKGTHYLRNSLIVGASQSYIQGNVYYDFNKNGIRDTNEYGRNNIKINISPDNVSAYTDANGNYSVGVINGTHTVSLADTNYLVTSSPGSYSVTVNNNFVTGKDFGISLLYPLYTSTIFTDGKRHCNRLDNYWIQYQNNGNVAYNGYVYMVMDPLMTFVSATPAQSSINGDTIFWNVTNVQPGILYQIIAEIINPAGGITVGYSATIVAINDTAKFGRETTITCGADPNEKTITPEGTGSQHFISSKDTLQYTLYFQNTGNDTTFKVVILDRLDANLDWSTFKVLGSSHSVSTELNQSTGLLAFTFFNILLPDSGTDQPGSNGFVSYSIKPKAVQSNYSTINNNANIYFDSNKPVPTNSTLNTICVPIVGGINTLIMQPNAVNGIDAVVCSASSTVNTNFATHPDMDATSWGYILRSFIRFDLSSIPTNATVQQATLTLYNNPTSTAGIPNGQHLGANASWLQKVTAPWDENIITWNNQPATTTASEVILPQSTSPHQDYPLNVTTLAQNMVSNPASNFGFMLRLQTESGNNTLEFASSDNADPSKWPKLSITYGTYIDATGPTTFCNGGSVILNAPTDFGNSYQWQLNGANISGDVSSSYAASSAGNYTCVVTTPCGSATLNTINVVVNAAPIITMSSNSPICSGDTLKLSSSGGLNYSWTGPNGFASGVQNPSIANINAANAGSYKVTVSDSSGCSTSDSTVININPSPNATIYLDAGDLTAYCTTSGCHYQWYQNGNATCTDSSTCLPIGDGDYNVVITDANGCSSASAPFIITNMKEKAVSDLISIYPNPVTDELNISFAHPLSERGEIMITDILGNEVARYQVDGLKNVQHLKLPKLAPGLYLAKLKTKDRSLNVKFVVE